MPRRRWRRRPQWITRNSRSSPSTTAAAITPAKCSTGLPQRIPKLRVVHLASNQGKATAMNVGALLARHELLVCIDGDALLDPKALHWIARAFRRGDVGGVGGNPRIRNRTSMLGKLQVGEFAAIIGLIRRAQTMYGRLFTVSGVICAFRKRALEEAGWWSPHTITDDIDVTWRVQLAGWRVIYEPNAIVWILMPETLRGLWRQRLRWAEGGVQMMLEFFRPVIAGRVPTLLPTYINYVLSMSGPTSCCLLSRIGLLWSVGLGPTRPLPAFRLVPEWWGLTLTLTYLVQTLVSAFLESRYERGMLRSLFWMIWYPRSLLDAQRGDHGRCAATCIVAAKKGAHDLGQSGPGSPMTGPNRPWPPLIVARHTPRLVKWRDILLTAMMWGFFALLLDTEFELFMGITWSGWALAPSTPMPIGRCIFDRPDCRSCWWQPCSPSVLIIFGLRTLRRRSRALLLPQPAPLETADQARRAGLDEAVLIAARDQRIVIVHIDADGRHRIEVPPGQ